MLRLPETTPMYTAFNEARKHTKLRKTNKKTWLKTVNEDLQGRDSSLTVYRDDIRDVAGDRQWWRVNVVKRDVQCLHKTDAD